jgi:transcriptional regulator with XRE-family HTH domain
MELLGKRLAAHRARLGWTQAEVAARVGISRAALSHLESSLSVAGERTVAILAGLFGCEPYELVVGTDYPPAKVERLPLVAARYTEVAHTIACMDAQLAVIAMLDDSAVAAKVGAEVERRWFDELVALRSASLDPRERDALSAALERLRSATARPGPTGETHLH